MHLLTEQTSTKTTTANPSNDTLNETSSTPEHQFMSVDKALAFVLGHAQEWEQLALTEKALLVGESIHLLRTYRHIYATRALERRHYTRHQQNPEEKHVVAIETEKALIYQITTLHLVVWLAIIKDLLEYVSRHGCLPEPTHIRRNHDGSLRAAVGPSDFITWLLSGTASLEIHLENLTTTGPTLPSRSSTEDVELDTGRSSENSLDGEKLQTQPSRSQDIEIGTTSNSLSLNIKNLQYSPDELRLLHQEHFQETVAVVLGAGNYDAPVDLLTALLIEHRVVVYKFSPLSEHLIEPFSKIFAPFVKRGYLAFVTGGPTESSSLIHNPVVSKWFMTGNAKTANSILFGTTTSPFSETPIGTVPHEVIESKLKINKPFTIELGNVTPYIICPGVWKTTELLRHARYLVWGLLFNGGHVCAHPQVILTCRGWQQRDIFLKYVRQALNEAATMGHFYPNANTEFDRLKNILGKETNLPAETPTEPVKHIFDVITPSSLFLTGLSDTSELLTQETFCSIAGEIPIDSEPTITDFLPKAVALANEKMYGTLTATIIAKIDHEIHQNVVDESIVNLRYGSVGLNVHALLSIYFPQLIWGGFPKNVDVGHLESGIGHFGNAYGYKHVLKSVVRCPFIGTNQFIQVIPIGREIRQLQKMFDRTTVLMCARATRQSYLSQWATMAQIMSAAVLGFHDPNLTVSEYSRYWGVLALLNLLERGMENLGQNDTADDMMDLLPSPSVVPIRRQGLNEADQDREEAEDDDSGSGVGDNTNHKDLSDLELSVLRELQGSVLLKVIEKMEIGVSLSTALELLAPQILRKVKQAFDDQYVDNHVVGTATSSGVVEEPTPGHQSRDIGNVALDPTIRDVVGISGTSTSFLEDVLRMARVTPLRLSYEERSFLRLLESTLEVSEYTDKVDILGRSSAAKRMAGEIKQICAVLSGLVVAHKYEAGQRLIRERDFKANSEFFRSVFEIGRRYKILNPERMRDSYGKLVYFLMDSRNPSVMDQLEFDCVALVKTVWGVLSQKKNGLKLLRDPLLRLATTEIEGEGKTRSQIQWEIKEKENAIRQLVRTYSTVTHNSQGLLSRFTSTLFRGTADHQSHDGAQSLNGSKSGYPCQDMSEQQLEDFSPDEVEQCLYSLCDHTTFLRFNRQPCDKMIHYLKRYFRPQTYEPGFSLSISCGRAGARLSHSHERQYLYVLQSLTLWREVLHDMLGLWCLAEKDLLSPSNPYVLGDTGQGLNRVQEAPHVYRSMYSILSRVQERVGGWCGSSVIHLGDHNVPNALVFIDKYIQIPRILGPLVICLDKIPTLYQSTLEMKTYIDDAHGGCDILM